MAFVQAHDQAVAIFRPLDRLDDDVRSIDRDKAPALGLPAPLTLGHDERVIEAVGVGDGVNAPTTGVRKEAVGKAVLPLIGFALTVWLWTSLSATALIIGMCWLAVGFVWLLGVTRGFTRPTPVMDMKE